MRGPFWLWGPFLEGTSILILVSGRVRRDWGGPLYPGRLASRGRWELGTIICCAPCVCVFVCVCLCVCRPVLRFSHS